jgi:hypothetical protein
MLDEIVGEPVGRVLEILIPKHFLGKAAYGLHAFWREHAVSFSSAVSAVGAGIKASDVILRSSCRGEVQHLVDGEAASAVGRRYIASVAELGPKLGRSLVVTRSVGHPDARTDRAADSVGRAEECCSKFRLSSSRTVRCSTGRSRRSSAGWSTSGTGQRTGAGRLSPLVSHSAEPSPPDVRATRCVRSRPAAKRANLSFMVGLHTCVLSEAAGIGALLRW